MIFWRRKPLTTCTHANVSLLEGEGVCAYVRGMSRLRDDSWVGGRGYVPVVFVVVRGFPPPLASLSSYHRFTRRAEAVYRRFPV